MKAYIAGDFLVAIVRIFCADEYSKMPLTVFDFADIYKDALVHSLINRGKKMKCMGLLYKIHITNPALTFSHLIMSYANKTSLSNPGSNNINNRHHDNGEDDIDIMQDLFESVAKNAFEDVSKTTRIREDEFHLSDGGFGDSEG